MHPSAPPVGWPQRARYRIPFTPTLDGARVEIYLDADAERGWEQYRINLETLEVYARRQDGYWDQPAWWELPERVRGKAWKRTTHRT